MTSSLPEWPRPYFQYPEGESYWFYVIFGGHIEEIAVSESQYRCDGVHESLDLLSYGPTVHPEVLNTFRSGPLWDDLVQNDPELAAEIGKQTECVVLRGSLPDGPTLRDFRNIIGLITFMIDQGAVAVYDPQGLKWWSAEEWTTGVFESDGPEPEQHVVILVSQEGPDAFWFHTRGLRKFARPDLSLHNAPAALRQTVTDLFQRLVHFQAFGGVLSETQEIIAPGLPPGMYCRHGGSVEDPDFNNAHVEILWPSRTG